MKWEHEREYYIQWYFLWRRLHSLQGMKTVGEEWYTWREEWRIDVGYCLDRYTING